MRQGWISDNLLAHSWGRVQSPEAAETANLRTIEEEALGELPLLAPRYLA
jgi:hypothetical protein